MFVEEHGLGVDRGPVGVVATPVRLRRRGTSRKADAAFQAQVRQAKRAFATRRVDLSAVHGLVARGVAPRAGDLVLARVTRLGQHKRVELVDGRRSVLYVGDEIIVSYGARYAPDQFEAEVPDDLSPCDLVAGGGLAGAVVARHARMRQPTQVAPLGLLVDREGAVINLADWALPDKTTARRPMVIAVAGSSMNAGKTTTASHLVKGLSRAGLKVGAAKVTGTGSGGDLWALRDAGASPVLDFTDAGYASTFHVPAHALVGSALKLVAHLAAARSEVVVLEVADGLFQAETAALLAAPAFRDRLDAVVFAAGDAMGAAYGVDWLRRNGLPVVAVSGLVTASPLGLAEAARVTGVPIAPIQQLADGAQVAQIVLGGTSVSLAAAANR